MQERKLFKKIVLGMTIAVFFTLGTRAALADNLSTGSDLFNPSSTMNTGPTQAQAPDAYHEPQSRISPNQVPEKLQFVFQGHQYGMQQMGNHFVSDVQTLLRDIEAVNLDAWKNFFMLSADEYTRYSSADTPASVASAPAGALAISALDNAGAVGRQNVQFGIPFLFEGLGLQQGSDCNGTVRGMLRGQCKWGTPPKIESAVFAHIIGDDANLNQLNGAYEVWGVAPARSTLISLIFNQGLFQ